MRHTITISEKQKNLIIEALEKFIESIDDSSTNFLPETLEDKKLTAEEIITDLIDEDDD